MDMSGANFAHRYSVDTRHAPAFLPISLTAPTKNSEVGCDCSDSEAPAADNRIEIELLNGRRVRVGPGADMDALKRILDIVDGRQRP